jgi:glucose-1-phosphate thymidylyltransferase
VIGADFVGGDSVALILGDNLFYGQELGVQLQEHVRDNAGATIFAYHVADPERYGVVELDETGAPIGLVEKPAVPKSSLAVPGLYLFDNDVLRIARELRPSPRGELEITEVNATYLRAGRLRVRVLSRGNAWLDTGTHDSLLDAGNFVAVVEKRTGQKIACLEEISFRLGYTDEAALAREAQKHGKTEYGRYLMGLAKR